MQLEHVRALRVDGSAEVPSYWRTYSGDYDGMWLTRFDASAPRFVHTVDPRFGFEDWQDNLVLEIEIDDPDSSDAWFLLPLLGLGMVRRRKS